MCNNKKTKDINRFYFQLARCFVREVNSNGILFNSCSPSVCTFSSTVALNKLHYLYYINSIKKKNAMTTKITSFNNTVYIHLFP